MAGILSVLRIFSAEPIEIRFAHLHANIIGKIQKTAVITILVTAMGVAVVIAIWASFCFRFSALTENGPPRQMWDARWDLNLTDHTLPEKIIIFARDHHLLPEAYLYGLAYVNERSQYRPAFLDNHWSNVGFVSFFPCAFFYKTPLPIIGLIAMTLLVAAVRWKRRLSDGLIPIGTIVARDCVKPGAHSDARQRLRRLCADDEIKHWPPPPSSDLSGDFHWVRSVRLFSPKGRTNAGWGLGCSLFLGWQLIESCSIRPDYLAYFNQIAGGPRNGYKHLVDSSLDWGQDLPALKSLVR